MNLSFDLTTYKVVIESENNYQLDLSNTKFGELIGFEPKLITQTEHGSTSLMEVNYQISPIA